MKSFAVLVVVALVEVRGAIIREGLEIPTYHEPCRRNDPNMNDCIKTALKAFITAVAKDGVKDIGVPPLDPFYLPELLTAYNNRDIQSSNLLKNVFTHGLSQVTIYSIRSSISNPEKMFFEADVHFPEIFTEGTYKMDGHVGNFLLNGRGVYNVTMKNVNNTIRIEAKIVEIGGEQFLKATKVISTPEIGDMKISASNLVNGNPELSAVANQFANQFWRLFYKEMLPYAQETFDKVARSLINKPLLTIPYSQLLPAN